MTDIEAMRREFEAWASKDVSGLNNYAQMIMRDSDDNYISYPLQRQWDSWKAATAQATATARELCINECKAHFLKGSMEHAIDRAYNRAINHCVFAIRQGGTDPVEVAR